MKIMVRTTSAFIEECAMSEHTIKLEWTKNTLDFKLEQNHATSM